MWILNPKRIFHEGKIAFDIQKKKVRNLLNTPYWSMVPYMFAEKQMKYRVVPCQANPKNDVDDSENFLSKNLAASLQENNACFNFQVQLRTDPNSMPIEDATIEWKEEKAPFVDVAKITIPSQRPLLDENCERTAFNPWHSLTDHRPLGGISRTRRVVYKAISELRNELNQD